MSPNTRSKVILDHHKALLLYDRMNLMDREKRIVARIIGYLSSSKKIIDIGCGRGIVTKLLRKAGKNVTAVDVKTFKYGRSISDVIIYDGKKLPFFDKSFDTALLLIVMHHTPNPSAIFQEAARVAREVVVIETTYRNLFEKIYTVMIDSLANLQPEFYWNSYKKGQEWMEIFKGFGFKVESSQLHFDRVLGVPFLHAIYYLKRNGIKANVKTKD